MNMQLLEKPSMHVFDELESEVRSYCRSFTTIFNKAINDTLWDVNDREYIDFFAGAGALNYGHNNPLIKKKLVEYLLSDGITHSLDMATEAKEQFLERFDRVILQPRNLEYKIMFPGPTGTNSVESALKIARKVTGRETVICFTNAFHGMTLGSLAVTGNKKKREGAGVTLDKSIFMPYDGYFGKDIDTADYIEKMLDDDGSGIAIPAAIILETLQGEGGLQLASPEWLQKIERICKKREILLIVDDVQMGCGRTGTFFSFETAGLNPDVVCLSKSIGGYGLPMALMLLKPGLDIFTPGEHNGTFRGNNLGFIAAAEALSYWETEDFSQEIAKKSLKLQLHLKKLVKDYPEAKGEVRGKGMIQGITFDFPGLAEKVCALAFDSGLIMETSGPNSEAIKIMPPLTIEDAVLDRGLLIVEESLKVSLRK